MQHLLALLLRVARLHVLLLLGAPPLPRRTVAEGQVLEAPLVSRYRTAEVEQLANRVEH